MARANVEVSVWTDPRFKVLARCLGVDLFSAVGRMTAVWGYCTKEKTYVASSETLNVIAEHEYFAQFVVECGLGETTDSGIRIKGTRGRIEWLARLRNNGKKGGRPKKTKQKPEGNQKVTRTEPGSNPLTLTLSPSLTLSPILKNKEHSVRSEVASAPVAPTKDLADSPAEKPGGRLVREYILAYRKRYGDKTRPEITGKTAGQVKNLLQAVPVDRAIQLVQVYLQMDDRWFETKCHDFSTFIENLTKVGLALDTGQADPSSSVDIDRILDRESAS